MKGKSMKILMILLITLSCSADTYWVEVDSVTKEQESSYILKDGEVQAKLPLGSSRIEITQSEYLAISDGKSWKKDYQDWKKIQINSDKIDAGLT